MNDLIDFFGTLLSKDKDNFNLVIYDILNRSSEIEIGKLNKSLENIKLKIDENNRIISELKQDYNRCEILIRGIDYYTEKMNKDLKNSVITDSDFSLKYNNLITMRYLKTLLMMWLDQINDEIISQKPAELLEKKHKIKKSKNVRILLNELISDFLKHHKEKGSSSG